MLQILIQRLIERTPPVLRISLQIAHASFAKIPLRYIGNAPEGDVVPVDKHAKIAQRVLDLRPAKELNA